VEGCDAPDPDADVGVVDVDIDFDYVTDVTFAQGAWALWPTHD